MKFWKISLLTTILFFAFCVTVLYTACEQDPCNNVVCYNGGSCGNGICHCPTGYENTQCQDKSVTRYLGTYAGYIGCNDGAEVIDSAFIYADTSSASMINYVWVKLNSIAPTILHGYVYYNQSIYSIVVPEVNANNDLKIYTITLQNFGNSENNKLSINTFDKNESVPGDTVTTQCNFLGFKQ